MFGFIKSVFRPFASIGSKIGNVIGNIGRKFINVISGGEAIGRIGREALISERIPEKFINIGKYENIGNNRYLRGSDEMYNQGYFKGW